VTTLQPAFFLFLKQEVSPFETALLSRSWRSSLIT
jgi:hypothetical protein